MPARPDISDKIIHFTRGTDVEDAFSKAIYMQTENQWRVFADKLLQLSEKLCSAMPGDLTENQRLVVSLLYARSHQSFKSAVLLAERGYNGDARTLVRSAVESAIAIAATGKDAVFVDRLVEADQDRRLRWIRATLNDPELQHGHSPEDLQRFRDTIVAAGDTKPRGIHWDAVAATSNTKVLYHLHYRPMSWHTHVGIESLNEYALLDAKQDIVGPKCNGDTAGYAATVEAACDVIFWAGCMTSEFFGLTELLEEFRVMHRRYDKMIKAPAP